MIHLHAVRLFATLSIAFSTLASADEWRELLDSDLSQWDIFMGAPHTTTDIKGYEKFDDVTKGTPIGLNKDPKKVFTTKASWDGSTELVVSGEIFAGLVTKEEFSNYHLTVQFRWGEKKWEPRLNKQRNSGVLYHGVGNYTDFWNVWLTCLEAEVMEGDSADFIPLGDMRAKVPAIGGKTVYDYAPDADLVEFAWLEGYETGRCRKPGDPEKPHGQWNTLEIIALGNQTLHVLNGIVVMCVVDPEVRIDGKWQPLNAGKIQLQSEAAEVFFRDVRIKQITAFPNAYAEHVVK